MLTSELLILIPGCFQTDFLSDDLEELWGLIEKHQKEGLLGTKENDASVAQAIANYERLVSFPTKCFALTMKMLKSRETSLSMQREARGGSCGYPGMELELALQVLVPF